MAWANVAIAGASLVGGYIAGEGAKDAANSQAGAAKDANQLQWNMFQQQRRDNEPWREAGSSALQQIQNGDFKKDFSMADFAADPGYQFRMQEGQNAINNAAAARGMGNSGATLKALARYGQDYASGEYNNVYNRFNADRDRRFNRLSSLAGIGQTANSQIANAGQNYANNASNNLMSAGNARAAGQVANSNAVNGAIGQGMNSWMNYQMMNRMFPNSPDGTTAGSATSPRAI